MSNVGEHFSKAIINNHYETTQKLKNHIDNPTINKATATPLPTNATAPTSVPDIQQNHYIPVTKKYGVFNIDIHNSYDTKFKLSNFIHGRDKVKPIWMHAGSNNHNHLFTKVVDCGSSKKNTDLEICYDNDITTLSNKFAHFKIEAIGKILPTNIIIQH